MNTPDTSPTSGERRPGERRRTPPAERLATPELVIDTQAVLTTLRDEATRPTQHGHRQMAVLHRGPVRMVVFAFDAGGGLPEHTADGLVTIHVLSGALFVHTPNGEHEINAGMVLVLDPQTRHDVTATQPTAMLLTVHLSAERAGATA